MGAGSLELAVARAGPFVAVLGALEARRVIDVGAGGGLPGLVVARALPTIELVLLDRRARRTDFLERAVRRLGLHDRVTVVIDDAAASSREVGHRARYDAAIARGLGPPSVTAELCRGFISSTGVVVVAEPPIDADYDRTVRWPDAGLSRAGLRWSSAESASVAVLEATGPCPSDLPRRLTRVPLW